MSRVISNATDVVIERRSVKRFLAEQVLQRAQHLAAADRLLVEQVYGHGVAVADLARLTKQPARSLRRRLAGLIRRMNSPLFRYVLANGELLPAQTRRVAELVVLQGYSLRRAAAISGASLHVIRQQIRVVQTLAEV